ALEELAEKGFTTDFNLEEESIAHNANEFSIEHIYRYEGESDPGDEVTVYGIKSDKGEKGVFVVGPGGYENDAARRLLDMSIKDRAQNQ
ncbi:MAG: hypothetical protein V4581_14345, partial [Bacteroidota bacterium]